MGISTENLLKHIAFLICAGNTKQVIKDLYDIGVNSLTAEQKKDCYPLFEARKHHNTEIVKILEDNGFSCESELSDKYHIDYGRFRFHHICSLTYPSPKDTYR